MTEGAHAVPVIVGVGQVNDRPAEGEAGRNSLDLMEAALRAAERDAGGNWLAAIDSLAVVAQISCPELGDVSAPLAARLGATPRLCSQTPYPMGDSPILLLNEAANRIAAGEIGVTAVVGGEALRSAARRAAAGGNATREISARHAPSFRRRYGLVAPTDIYPLYENATRAAWGQTLAQAQQENAAIWARLSRIAAGNPAAWIRTPRTEQEILTPSAENRPIAFPYGKLMVANSAVNQGAGFIVTSLARARAAGIDEARLVYVWRGAAAYEPPDFLARDRFDRSAAMQVCLTRALAFNGLTADDLDFVELYSCFPCVPKMARRVIGWPVERDASVYGGLTFGGGPIGNAMGHAVACMVQRLRASGRHGLLFGNGGFATTNHAIVLSRHAPPPGALPASFDVQAEADALREPAPSLMEDYTGPGRIETYTVFYDRQGSADFGVIVARSPDGSRFLAKIPGSDREGIGFLTCGRGEPVGAPGVAVPGGDGDVVWGKEGLLF
jgi:acetyl-CoA C-acetyltransferase